MTLDFLSAGPGYTSFFDKLYGIYLYLVFLSDVLTNEINKSVQLHRVALLHLLHDHQSLFISDLDRECRASRLLEHRVTLLYCHFYVLRVMIVTTNDNELFEAPGNE